MASMITMVLPPACSSSKRALDTLSSLANAKPVRCVPHVARARVVDTKLDKTATAKEDLDSPIEILKRVPEEFLQEHLTER